MVYYVRMEVLCTLTFCLMIDLSMFFYFRSVVFMRINISIEGFFFSNTKWVFVAIRNEFYSIINKIPKDVLYLPVEKIK